MNQKFNENNSLVNLLYKGGAFDSTSGTPIDARNLNGNGNETIAQAGFIGSSGNTAETTTKATTSTSPQPPSSTEPIPVFDSPDEIIYGEKRIRFYKFSIVLLLFLHHS
jgi:hypothetical protein